MSTTIIIIASITGMVMLAGVILLLRIRMNKFRLRLTKLVATSGTGYSAHAAAFRNELKNYRSTDELAERADQQVRKLRPLTPVSPVIDISSVGVINSICEVVDEKSPWFAGSEQVLLMFIPPDQVAESVCLIADELAKHCSLAAAESLATSKDAFLSGIHNIQDPEVIAHSVKNFLGEVLKNLLHPDNLESVEAVYLASGIPGVLVSIIGPEAIYKGFDPAFHFKEYLHDLGAILKDHAVTASADLGDSLGGGFSPDFVPHLPYFTVAFSSIREFRLLYAKKTDLGSSIKNAGLDVVGTTSGMVTSWLVLTPVLDFILPGAGMLTAFVATAFGGWFGRKASNKIKHLPLNRAIDEFNSLASNAEYFLKNKANGAFTVVESLAKTKHREFLEKIGRPPRNTSRQVKLAGMGDAIQDELRGPAQALENRLTQLKQSWFSRLRRFSADIQALETQIRNMNKILNTSYADPATRLEALVSGRFIYTEPCENLIAAKLDVLRQLSKEGRSEVLLWSVNASGEYQLACFAVVNEIQLQLKDFKEELKDRERQLAAQKRVIVREKEKLGR